MKVSIAGGGVVGRSIARDLVGNGHEVLIVEQDQAVVRRQTDVDPDPHVDADRLGTEGLGINWFAGDACEVSTLHEAGFGQADVVVAATGDDEDNLVVSLLSKQEFAVPRVIARVNHPKNEWLFNESWGVDVAVSTPHLITALVEEALSVGTLVRLLHFAEGKAGLVEVTLAEDSPAVSRPISQLGMPRDSSVVAIVRNRRVVVPRGDTVLDPADEVIVLVTEDSEDGVRHILVG
ncbi:MAG: TrkA family potassium uptake protein [Actinomycetota bacterium]|nr:TrkA family potassium uptake protein [Actinomycetota bacterium]